MPLPKGLPWHRWVELQWIVMGDLSRNNGIKDIYVYILHIYTYIHNRLYSTHINVFLFVTSSVYHGNGYITNNMIVTFSHRVWSSSNDDHFPKLIHQIAVETWVK